MRSTDLPQLIPVELALPNGTVVSLRPLGPDDRERLAVGFERLSAESRYRRFMTPTPRLSAGELNYFSKIDYRNHFAWGVQVVNPDRLDGAGGTLGAEQAISVAEALYAYTMGGAIASGDDGNCGSLAIGKWVDLAILSGNPLTTPVEQLTELVVDQTWVGGRLAYER